MLSKRFYFGWLRSARRQKNACFSFILRTGFCFYFWSNIESHDVARNNTRLKEHSWREFVIYSRLQIIRIDRRRNTYSTWAAKRSMDACKWLTYMRTRMRTHIRIDMIIWKRCRVLHFNGHVYIYNIQIMTELQAWTKQITFLIINDVCL